ncbi:hypothetical protein GCM10011588_62770 [Nocardia jinanensis]|uniref:Uncharacterized protein n=1 Tax=Nocardia jinanensis TaxID=382504 RepID=A0A917RVX4_9NOCA|nr:hypothetical protein GCM10011588_62770 [Nocardia jinanensis]
MLDHPAYDVEGAVSVDDEMVGARVPQVPVLADANEFGDGQPVTAEIDGPGTAIPAHPRHARFVRIVGIGQIQQRFGVDDTAVHELVRAAVAFDDPHNQRFSFPPNDVHRFGEQLDVDLALDFDVVCDIDVGPAREIIGQPHAVLRPRQRYEFQIVVDGCG